MVCFPPIKWSQKNGPKNSPKNGPKNGPKSGPKIFQKNGPVHILPYAKKMVPKKCPKNGPNNAPKKWSNKWSSPYFTLCQTTYIFKKSVLVLFYASYERQNKNNNNQTGKKIVKNKT